MPGLLLEAEVDAKDNSEQTALHLAAEGGHTEVVKLLLEKGAEINSPGGLYGRPLQHAVRSRNEALVRLLLDKGADINAQGGVTKSALIEAVDLGLEGLVRLLVENGANVNAKGPEYHDSTPLQLAVRMGRKAIV
jgi:ankyrin repeat protein